MFDAPHNRISGLTDGDWSDTAVLVAPTPAPTPRTDAQREASRRNGSRGRGPATAAGKLKSRANALKHGLLARVLCPPSDLRGQDALYRDIRRGLVKEFRPAGASGLALIDAMARDYLQLARAGAMAEALQRPAPLPAEQEKRRLEVRETRRELNAVRRAMAYLHGGGDGPDGDGEGDGEGDDEGQDEGDGGACPPGFARRVAERVAAHVRDLAEYVVVGEDEVPEDKMNELDLKNLKEAREELASLGAHAKKLSDPARVAAVLCGETRPVRGEARRLLAVLGAVAESLKGRLARRGEESRKASWFSDAKLAALAAAPEPLILPQRYQTMIERSIALKLRMLGALGRR